MPPPVWITSSSPGAPTLSGTVGELVRLYDEVLCLGRAFGFRIGDETFVDWSADSRLVGGTPVPVLATATDGAEGDCFYLGGAERFDTAWLTLETVGDGGAYAYEFWNGTAWTALIDRIDGTELLTQSGVIVWDRAAQTGWASTTVSGALGYWIRIRCLVAPTTAPWLSHVSLFGWAVEFTGTNQRVYRSVDPSGVRHYYRVDDNAPADAGDARLRAYETMSDLDTGAMPFPTVAQMPNGVFLRKSATLTGFVRPWQVAVDPKTVYTFVLTGDSPTQTYRWDGFGEFESFIPGDLFRSFVACSNAEGTGIQATRGAMASRSTPDSLYLHMGLYVCRSIAGLAPGTAAMVSGVPASLATGPASTYGIGGVGAVPLYNAADGAIILGPVFLGESGPYLRGRVRGVWDWAHPLGGVNDGDTFSGFGAQAGLGFRIVKPCNYHQQSNSRDGVTVLETTAWEAT